MSPLLAVLIGVLIVEGLVLAALGYEAVVGRIRRTKVRALFDFKPRGPSAESRASGECLVLPQFQDSHQGAHTTA